ncbi:MAG: hypothetical protein J6Q82_06675 [Clostridia bacterium]|nr:hypothetical protein [Clostridia bacterium]
MANNNMGGVIVRWTERKEKSNEAFAEGFLAGLTVIGGIASILLLIFWL